MDIKSRYPIITKRASGDIKYIEEKPDREHFYYPVIRWVKEHWPTDITEYVAKLQDEEAYGVMRVRKFNYAKAMILDLLLHIDWRPDQWLSQIEIRAFTGLSKDTVSRVLVKCTEKGYTLVKGRGIYITKEDRRRLINVYRIMAAGKHWLQQAQLKQFIGDPRYRISVREVSTANWQIYLDAHHAIIAQKQRVAIQKRERVIIERMAAIMPEPDDDGPGPLFYRGDFGS